MTVGGVAIERNDVGEAVGVVVVAAVTAVAVWLLCCSSLSEKPESCKQKSILDISLGRTTKGACLPLGNTKGNDMKWNRHR